VRRVPLREGLPDDDAVSLLRQFDPDGEGGLRDAPDAILREAARKVHGVPYALERIAGILRSTPDLSLERFLGDHELFSGQVVENLAEYSYTHLSESARRVMEALAVFDRPAPETAVRYLLLPFAPDVDVTGELRRLWREMLVISNRTTGTFALHPLDREAAYRRLEQAPSFPTLLPEGGGRFPSPFGRGARGEGQPYDSHSLELRAAEYYKETRKPREQWKTIDDLEPQLAEFEHRVRAADYDGAGWLLDEIDFDYLQLWGHALRVIGMREKLTGHLTGRTLEQKNWGFIGLCYWAIGQARRAVECYERALEQAQADHDRQGECAWLGNLGNAYLTLGETHRTLQLLEQALTIAREIGARQVEGVSLGSLGLVHSNQGEPQQAIEFYRQALAIARDIGDRRVEDAWLGHLGNAYFALGKLRHAIEAYEQALIIAREIGNRRDENALRGCLGRAYVALGEPQEAIEFFDQALTMARSIGDRYVEGDLLGSMGSAYFAMDIADQAIELYHSALAAARDIGDRSGQSRWLLGLSMAYQTMGDLSQARTCAEQSLALDMPDTVGGAALRLGILAVQSGNRAGAAQYFGLAISKCRDLLDKTPELYGVLYADGTALAGQAAINRRSLSGGGQSSAVALEIYQRAIDIFAGPTILKNTLRDLRYLQSAGCEGLELVIQLLETRAA